MIGIVDRFEGDYVVIEVDDTMYNFSKKYIEGEIKEGDTVEIVSENGRIVAIKKNEEMTISRKKYIEDLTKDMWS